MQKLTYVYILMADDIQGRFYKIGISDSLVSRFSSVKSPFGGDITILARVPFNCRAIAREVETVLHETLDEYRCDMLIGQGNGNSEWFKLDEIALTRAMAIMFICTTLNQKQNRIGVDYKDKDLEDLASIYNVIHRNCPGLAKHGE